MLGLLAAGALAAAVGCGTANQTTNTAVSAGGGNPSFSVLTSVDKMTPDGQFDPTLASEQTYAKVTVYDAEGHKVTLDARKQPILFEAYWCPHCQRTIQMFEKQIGQLPVKPVLVSLGFAKGTTFLQAKAIGEEETAALGIKGLSVYYFIDPNTAKYVPEGYPTMVFNDGETLKSLYGEHTFSAWQTAFEAAKKSTKSA